MKSLIFDTSTIISITTNNLLHLIKPLKNLFGGDFLIPINVKKELVDRPLTTKKFKLEALMILDNLTKGCFKLYENPIVRDKANSLLSLANSIYSTNRGFIRIVDLAEIETLALALYVNANACVIDERTTRMLIENPEQLAKLFETKLHTNIMVNKQNLEAFKKEAGKIKIIRSVELMLIAYEQGMLDEYITELRNNKPVINKILKHELVDGLLWGLRLNGCSISTEEINELIELETK